MEFTEEEYTKLCGAETLSEKDGDRLQEYLTEAETNLSVRQIVEKVDGIYRLMTRAIDQRTAEELQQEAALLEASLRDEGWRDPR